MNDWGSPKIVLNRRAKIHFSLVACLLCVLISVSTAAAQSCDSNDAVARMVSVQGQVSINQTGARQETLICRGDIVTVGPFSRAAIQLIETDTTLRIEQETRFRVLEPPAERESLLDLLKGAFYIFSREPRRLEIYTPFVNAAIEGTEFLVRVVEDRTFITVYEGRVLAANDKGQLTVGSAQSAVALQGQAPQLIEVIRPEDAVQWALYYRPILDALYDPKVVSPGLVRFLGAVDYRDVAGILRRLDSVPQSARDEAFYVYRAAMLQAVGRVELAQNDLDSARQLNPASGDVAALSAIIAVTRNDNEQALQLARQAVEQSPDSAAAQLALSYALQARLDLDGALAAVQAAIERDSDNALAHARLSELWLSKGELDKSLEAANQAVLLNPNVAHTQTVLGFANLSRIDIDTATNAFTKAIELDQAAPLPRLGLGLAKIRKGQLEAGRRDIEVAVSLDPLNSLFRSYLGKAYYEENRDALTDTQLELAKQLDPRDPTPWLYDAIRKQSENQPVAALHHIQKSIELNDNRAVYRSRLLLDEDQATRGTSLARIYDDLGFEQLAIVEGTKSLSFDPANHSAHRFLSDIYAKLPRHEIARDSELLQSQLLQPMNVNPVQPRLGDDGLSFLDNTIFANVGFNEFTQLFTANQVQVYTNGLIGNNDTWADNIIVSGIQNNTSYSFGQFHYETDGIRENNDRRQNIYNAFVQSSLTEQTSAALELRYNKIETGDDFLLFDPNNFFKSQREEFETKSIRLGFRHSNSPESVFIGSYVFREQDDDLVDPVDGFELQLEDDAHFFEVRHLLTKDLFNLTTGIGYFESEQMETVVFDPFPPSVSEGNVRHSNAYLYATVNHADNYSLTLGASVDDFSGLNFDRSQVNPKVGLTWDISPKTTFRAAAFRTLKRDVISSQTIEPTQVAGFNQFFDDVNGTDSWRYGIAIDHEMTPEFYVGAEFSGRDITVPKLLVMPPRQTIEVDEEEKFWRAYFYWIVSDNWVFNAEYQYDDIVRDPEFLGSDFLDQATTQRVPIGLLYFQSSGFFSGAQVTYVDQEGIFESSLGDTVVGSDEFWTVDVSLGYRFPKKRGIFALQIFNLFDEVFDYQDIDPRDSRIVPNRIIQGIIKLSF